MITACVLPCTVKYSTVQYNALRTFSHFGDFNALYYHGFHLWVRQAHLQSVAIAVSIWVTVTVTVTTAVTVKATASVILTVTASVTVVTAVLESSKSYGYGRS